MRAGSRLVGFRWETSKRGQSNSSREITKAQHCSTDLASVYNFRYEDVPRVQQAWSLAVEHGLLQQQR